MIPIRQLRGLVQSFKGPFRSATVYGSYRFNSTISTNVNVAQPSTPNTDIKTEKTDSKSINGSKKDTPTKKRPVINNKLREIRTQVYRTFKSTEDVGECKEIFEEAISYVRQIEQSDNIPNKDIYYQFQPLVCMLLEKMIAAGESHEALTEIFDKILTFKVAHNFNFFQVMRHNVLTKNYAGNFNLWIQYLEYRSKYPELIPLAFWEYPDHKEVAKSFRQSSLSDMVYFSYFKMSQAGQVEYKVNDLLSLLTIEELPPLNAVVRDLTNNGMTDMGEFKKFISANSRESMMSKPNTPEFWKHLNTLTERGYQRDILSLYYSFLESKTHLQLHTIYRFMSCFYELKNFNMVYQIFSGIVQQNAKLSGSIWSVVIKSLGYFENVKDLDEEQKKALSDNIDKMILSMTTQGTKVDAKLLSAIISSYSNLNNFERVNQYFKQYEDTLPIIHSTKNNHLSGLVLNGKVAEAEKQLTTYMREDDTYKPSVAVLNNLLSHYAKSQNLKAVKGIIDFMNKHVIAEDIATLTTLTNLFFKVNLDKGRIPKIDEVLKLFVKNNVQINSRTMSVLIDGLVKSRNIIGARTLYNGIKAPADEILTTMLKAELELGSVEAGQLIFDKHFLHARNPRHWNTIINSLLNKRESLALDYYHRLKKSDTKPNLFTFYFLLNHFVRRSNKEAVEGILNDIADANLPDLGSSLPRTINSLSNSHEIPEALKRYTT